MDQPVPLIVDAERRAQEAGLTVTELCARAGIHRATWQRWKSGKVGPTLKNWDRVEQALSEAAA